MAKVAESDAIKDFKMSALSLLPHCKSPYSIKKAPTLTCSISSNAEFAQENIASGLPYPLSMWSEFGTLLCKTLIPV